MKYFLPALLLLAACAHRPAEKAFTPAANAVCHEEDLVKWWERAYCQQRSGMGAGAREKCVRSYQAMNVPAEKCERIIWLKERVCPHWGIPKRERECLHDPGFQEKAQLNYEEYFGE